MERSRTGPLKRSGTGERLAVIIVLAGAWALYIEVKICRIFRPP
jgi:hypothetical protein